jgi:uncharacterized membrane protein
VSERANRTIETRIALRVCALVALAFVGALSAEYVLPSARFCEPGGGCDIVRVWAYRQGLVYALPLLGLIGFTALFIGSFSDQRAMMRGTAVAAMAGGVIAIGLIALQATAVGAYCWLCVGVDAAAIAAGACGAVLWRISARAPEKGRANLRTAWWAAYVLFLFAPAAWAATWPEHEVSPVVLARYREGALNVVELADFECPYCRAMHPVLRSALEDERDVNLVRIVVPLEFHLHARDAARAYFCAEREGKAEEMADALFAAEDISREGTIALARELHLDAGELERCLSDRAIERRIDADIRFAERAGFEGLPTVYIGQRVLRGFDQRRGAAPFEEAIAAARQGIGRRIEYWPLALTIAVALVVFAWGIRGRTNP